mmetsp:Transcript_47071/g.73484  ORF Transcript_47071/g.73484 Transcript_47071/m.73484 type:complete len:113 (+) Transcript_47071:699-1037(+)
MSLVDTRGRSEVRLSRPSPTTDPLLHQAGYIMLQSSLKSRQSTCLVRELQQWFASAAYCLDFISWMRALTEPVEKSWERTFEDSLRNVHAHRWYLNSNPRISAATSLSEEFN